MRFLLFDVDGVLADTEQVHENATCLAAGTYIDCSGGGSTMDKLRRAGYAEEEARLIYARKKLIYGECVAQVQSDWELVQMFFNLREPAAACSNSNRDSCHLLLHNLGILRQLKTVVTATDVAEMHKPKPDIYIEAMLRLQARPEECVVFEDSDEGIQSAQSAGIQTIVRCTRKTLIEEVKKCVLSFPQQV